MATSPPENEIQFHDYAELRRRVAKRTLVLFFGRATFVDNTKYLFLATLKVASGSDVL